MNKNIIAKLTQLQEFYQHKPEFKFKYSAINKALKYIREYPYEITSGKFAKENIPHIGTGISNRIDEILETNNLKELNTNVDSIENNAIKELKKITGVGDSKAKSLISMGIYNIDDYKKAIKEKKIKSTHHIDIGLKYFNDFEERIPREEIKKLENIIGIIIKNLDKNLVFNICGSYRRGKSTCGDIDILLTNPFNNDYPDYLSDLVNKLTKENILIDHLTTKGNKKYMGVCKIDKLARRIDIRFVKYSAYYAALIYFTGSKNFNIQIRNKALELGYSLNEYGLIKKKSNELIVLHSEKEVFEILGLEYLEPTERDI